MSAITSSTVSTVAVLDRLLQLIQVISRLPPIRFGNQAFRAQPIQGTHDVKVRQPVSSDVQVAVVGGGVVGRGGRPRARAPRCRRRCFWRPSDELALGGQRHQLGDPPHGVRLDAGRARDPADPALGRAARPGARRARRPGAALRRRARDRRRRRARDRRGAGRARASETASRRAWPTTGRSRSPASRSPTRSPSPWRWPAPRRAAAPSSHRLPGRGGRARATGSRVVSAAAAASRATAAVAVNCAGPLRRRGRALAGDDSLRDLSAQGRVLRLRPARRRPLERSCCRCPTKRTKGVLVFPTIDGKVIAGPTAHDQEDKEDWSVRPEAAEEVMPKALAHVPAARGRRADRELRRPAAGRARRATT